MDNKNKVTVRIFGSEYIVRIGNNNEEYVKGLADKVDAIMKEITKSNIKYNPTMVGVLAALNLADVLYKTQEELSTATDKLMTFQQEMQRPFEELNDLKSELEAVKEQYNKMQSEYTRTQIELGKITREWASSQEQIKDQKCELDVSRDTINDLQNKLFENQIELLKIKKENDEIKSRKFDKNRNNRPNI